MKFVLRNEIGGAIKIHRERDHDECARIYESYMYANPKNKMDIVECNWFGNISYYDKCQVSIAYSVISVSTFVLVDSIKRRLNDWNEKM